MYAVSFWTIIFLLTELIAKIDSLKIRLTRLREVIQDRHPQLLDSIPSPDDIDIKKLGEGGGNVTTDTCAAAQKLRRILVDGIPGAYDFDCMHHLRNVWFNGMEKALTKTLNAIL